MLILRSLLANSCSLTNPKLNKYGSAVVTKRRNDPQVDQATD